MTDKAPSPIPVKQLDRYFEDRPPVDDRAIAVERRFHVVADRQPQVESRVEAVDRGDGEAHWEVIVEIDGVRAGVRARPPALQGRATRMKKRRVSEQRLLIISPHSSPTISDSAPRHATGSRGSGPSGPRRGAA